MTSAHATTGACEKLPDSDGDDEVSGDAGTKGPVSRLIRDRC